MHKRLIFHAFVCEFCIAWRLLCNRTPKGIKRQLFNILIVWCLTGFWHGASWNFVIWGLYFGVLLIIEKKFLLKQLSEHKIFSHIYTLVLAIISWVIFAFDDISNVGLYLKAMLGLNGAGIFFLVSFYYLSANAIVLIACAVFSIDLFTKQKQRLKTNAFSHIVNAAKFAVYAAVFFISVCVFNDFTSFLIGVVMYLHSSPGNDKRRHLKK